MVMTDAAMSILTGVIANICCQRGFDIGKSGHHYRDQMYLVQGDLSLPRVVWPFGVWNQMFKSLLVSEGCSDLANL